MAQGDHKGSLTASVNSVTNPTNLSGSVAVVVGDLVFGCFSQQTALTAGGTVTDNLSNTYSYVNAGTDAGNATIRCFWSRVTNAGTLTQISVPATASTNDASAVASVIEGPFKSSPLDRNPANTQDGTSPHACPATGTLGQANEVVMAACSIASNVTLNATSPGTITQTVARANVSTGVQCRTVSATTDVTPEFGNGATVNAAQTTASFRLADLLAAQAGSFTFTGTAATLELDRKVTADAGSFSFTGAAASLEYGYVLTAAAGSFTFTGSGVTLTVGGAADPVLSAEAGSFAFTGTAASLEVGYVLAAASGSFVVTGTAASLEVGHEVAADAGAFSFTGTAASLEWGHVLAANAGSFAFTGTVASLEVGHEVAAAAGAFAFNGSDASLVHDAPNPVLFAESGSFAFTGTAASLEFGREVAAGAGSFSFTGTAASIEVNRVVIAGLGTFIVTGGDAGLTYSGLQIVLPIIPVSVPSSPPVRRVAGSAAGRRGNSQPATERATGSTATPRAS